MMFDYLKKYVEENEFQNSNKIHVFYKVSREEIKKAEQRMSLEFLVFFEVDSNCHIYIKIAGENKGKIYFGNKMISEDFSDFIRRISMKTNPDIPKEANYGIIR